jgi:hypothetical protein
MLSATGWLRAQSMIALATVIAVVEVEQGAILVDRRGVMA